MRVRRCCLLLDCVLSRLSGLNGSCVFELGFERGCGACEIGGAGLGVFSGVRLSEVVNAGVWGHCGLMFCLRTGAWG